MSDWKEESNGSMKVLIRKSNNQTMDDYVLKIFGDRKEFASEIKPKLACIFLYESMEDDDKGDVDPIIMFYSERHDCIYLPDEHAASYKMWLSNFPFY